MNQFEINNISKSYINHKALDDVSISIPGNSIFGLLGPNGAGKTTLIRIINQITGPDSGTIYIDDEKLKPSHTKIIGYLPEERGLYKKMKVGEQALYLAQLKGMDKKTAMRKLKVWFEKFEIQPWWNKKIEELSKGMQQKIQFIITVLHEPKLLIFDEPFSGFDPINVNLIKGEILKLKENGATIIFSTHNMESVEELCDNIALINNSKKILGGNVLEIKNKYKSNIFKAIITDYKHDTVAYTKNSFNVISNKQELNNTTLTIKIQDNSSPNDLLQYLMQYGYISSFNEVIPSMNEIFISKINEINDIKI